MLASTAVYCPVQKTHRKISIKQNSLTCQQWEETSTPALHGLYFYHFLAPGEEGVGDRGRPPGATAIVAHPLYSVDTTVTHYRPLWYKVELRDGTHHS